jgi:hypothetical protein
MRTVMTFVKKVILCSVNKTSRLPLVLLTVTTEWAREVPQVITLLGEVP